MHPVKYVFTIQNNNILLHWSSKYFIRYFCDYSSRTELRGKNAYEKLTGYCCYTATTVLLVHMKTIFMSDIMVLISRKLREDILCQVIYFHSDTYLWTKTTERRKKKSRIIVNRSILCIMFTSNNQMPPYQQTVGLFSMGLKLHLTPCYSKSYCLAYTVTETRCYWQELSTLSTLSTIIQILFLSEILFTVIWPKISQLKSGDQVYLILTSFWIVNSYMKERYMQE